MGAKFVVDIGSNDGIFLKPLKERGIRALGIDPSVNVSKIANDAGLETITAFFDAPTAKKIREEYGRPDVVVASSIFTHLEDPHQFIDAVKTMMADDGKFIIEVEYIGNIIKEVQFERFYLDRIFYYSLTSLRDLFALHDMQITDVEEIVPHGGSLRVTVQSTGAPSPAVTELIAQEAEKLTQEKLEEFKNNVDSYIKAFKTKLEEYAIQGVRVAGYSAPARVSTICNYGGIGPSLIKFIVDDSPLKQDRFSPGTHIPIVPKSYLDALEKKPEVLVVFAYEYFDDIKKKTQDGGYRYLWPIPPREVK
jgi:SAM-dependent methyltransferase